MPVEERLRHALADQAGTLRVDAEDPLVQVHRRRGRATAWKAAISAAAVVAVVAGAAAVMGTEPGRPAPAGPPDEPTGSPVDPIPLDSYTRALTVDEAYDAGFPRWEVRELFDGGERVRVVMQIRDQDEAETQENPWVLRFVDDDGQSRVRDGGTYYYDDDGLTMVSRWKVCLGCNYHFAFEVEHGRLSLEPRPGAQSYPMATLFAGDSWQRVRP